ncbi:probable calcium-binding protein CML32 [Arachis duranensis]|uniref:Probable calcium-binding protein CML32 n=1 Tax=Arachis duranensis TaxID=130453 RepID=A0A9C6WQ32_ARADU|nr:probable calcium-binding protein CML32 [Arachis duranensis]
MLYSHCEFFCYTPPSEPPSRCYHLCSESLLQQVASVVAEVSEAEVAVVVVFGTRKKILDLSFLHFQSDSSLEKSCSPPKNSSSNSSFQPKEEEIKWVFDKFDANKDGKISFEEFKAAIITVGWNLGDAEALNSFKAIDTDEDSFIGFDEFMGMFKGEDNDDEKVKQMEMKSAFQVFDLNGDGKISAEELSQVLKRLGENCNVSDCKKMVMGVDGNGDGFIDLNEFMTMMMSGNKLP